MMKSRRIIEAFALIFLCRMGVVQAAAQPVPLRPHQLDQLVARIALYPDPLLAQILTASTYPEQIPEAALWAEQHRNFKGDALAKAISDDHLPWDPAVLALLPFPSVLEMMSSDMVWTRQLGDAVLTQRGDVMEAVQRMRRKAYNYGYLRMGAYVRVVAAPGFIEILTLDPSYISVPLYDPVIVFARPARRAVISAVITFGPPVLITPFAPFGWASAGFIWPSHVVVVDRVPWARTWVNRYAYTHPYTWIRPAPPRVERHEIERHAAVRRHLHK